MTEDQIIEARRGAIENELWGVFVGPSASGDVEHIRRKLHDAARATLEADRALGLKLLGEESTREMDDAGLSLGDGTAPWDYWTTMWRAASAWPGAKK